jgi:hypothetical protein
LHRNVLPVQWAIWRGQLWRPRQDSNPRSRVRREFLHTTVERRGPGRAGHPEAADRAQARDLPLRYVVGRIATEAYAVQVVQGERACTRPAHFDRSVLVLVAAVVNGGR